MSNNVYKNSFWETDFLSQNGFDTLTSHMKEGQKSCKWLEDYLKQRAKAEEDYAKALSKISKATVGDFGTLRKSLEKLANETDAEHQMHLDVANKLNDQWAQISEFRERQKEDRKKHEELVHKAHKNKAELYRKMIQCRSTYETRYRAAEKSESDAEKLKFGSKAKEAEKARIRATQSRTAAFKADEEYKYSVTTLEEARGNWEKEHAGCCDLFQKMEEERIDLMRNMVWVLSNLVSDLCCQLDDSRENIRLVTEKCSEEADIREFAKLKSTSTAPLQQVQYKSCGPNGTQIQSPSPTANRTDFSGQGLPPIPNGSTNNSNHIYEVGEDPNMIFTAIFDYIPQSSDEMEIKVNDRIKQLFPPDSGWMKGLNLRTKETAMVPMNYVKN